MHKQDFRIKLGETVNLPFFWYAGDPVIYPITGIALGYPPTFTTASAHNLPVNKIPVQIVSITAPGPTQLNTCGSDNENNGEDEYHDSVYALSTGSVTFVLPYVNASTYPAYSSNGGYLVYKAPVNLTGYTAHFQARTALGGTVLLDVVDSSQTAYLAANPSAFAGLMLGGTEGDTTLQIPAATTAALTGDFCIYQLELTDGSGNVTRIASGTIRFSEEVI